MARGKTGEVVGVPGEIVTNVFMHVLDNFIAPGDEFIRAELQDALKKAYLRTPGGGVADKRKANALLIAMLRAVAPVPTGVRAEYVMPMQARDFVRHRMYSMKLGKIGVPEMLILHEALSTRDHLTDVLSDMVDDIEDALQRLDL